MGVGVGDVTLSSPDVLVASATGQVSIVICQNCDQCDMNHNSQMFVKCNIDHKSDMFDRHVL